MAAPAFSAVICLSPVSYTHLDVYKRQGFSLREALGADTAWICAHADAIALLPGWEKSTGATAENALAVALGLTRIILGKVYHART